MVYFDNAATTKVSEEVIADIVEALKNDWANPSSISEQGMDVKRKIEHARKQIADYINAEPEEIIFTASGSEANNLAIKGFLDVNSGYRTIVTTEIEHPSVYNTCMNLKGKGYIVKFAPLESSGKVSQMGFQSLVEGDHLHFASIMLVNNELGTVQYIKGLANIIHLFNGIIHTDATQAFGKIPIDVKDMDVDLMSVGLHKCGLPKGIGFLYKKKGILLSPIIHGGHQERSLRAGTENTAYIIAAGNHVERMSKKEFPNYKIIDYLYDKIYDTFVEEFGFFYNGAISRFSASPNLLSLTFPGINAEALITLLDIKGVQVSAGSACCAGDKTPSRVLKAIGLTDEEAFSTIRISIGEDTTTEECDEFVKILGECLASLKMME